jgi:hypothetical protein
MVYTETMMRKFNVTGTCYPDEHYMVDLTSRIAAIRKMVEGGDYFTINRSWQYGKTTILYALRQALKADYLCLTMSFQAIGDASYATEEAFCKAFLGLVNTALKIAGESGDTRKAWTGVDIHTIEELGEHLQEVAEDRKVVLMIDEVDRISNNRVFLNFLGMLRSQYLMRKDIKPAFQSVILVGVHDIKTIKLKMISEGIYEKSEAEGTHNSPWNIAAEFKVDLSFSPADICTMLADYESEHNTGRDKTAIAERIYFYTAGYPFMVSSICKTMDETPLSWDIDGVNTGAKLFRRSSNTLFDSLGKNLYAYPKLTEILDDLLIQGADLAYNRLDMEMNLGVMYGILKTTDGGKVEVSNIIFETLIEEWLMTQAESKNRHINLCRYTDEGSHFIKNGDLDMKAVIERFCVFLKSEYRAKDSAFIERNCRLIFLSFLRGIINGEGNYAVEPETRNFSRMDIQVFFNRKEYVVELKIWHGPKKEADALDQLCSYLSKRSLREGYLLSFVDSEKSAHEIRTIEHKGWTIHEAVAAFSGE